MTGPTNIIALDVGERRIGVAIASTLSRLPRPLTTLIQNADTLKDIRKLLTDEQVSIIVVGLPRNLSGDDTSQTVYVRKFAEQLEEIGIVIRLQDEAATSVKAEQELKNRGKPFAKADIDSLAATYILEDYLRTES